MTTAYHTPYATGGALTAAAMTSPLSQLDTSLGYAMVHLNVKAYGALGDGSTDDSVAINSAITAANTAGGGVVFVPLGTYIVGGAAVVTLKSNVILRGAGYGSVLKLKNSTTADIIKSAATNAATAITRAGIENLQLDGNKANQSNGVDLQQYGISLGAANDCWVRNVWVHDTQRTGIYLAGARNTVEGCTLSAIGKVGAAGSIIGRQGIQFDAYNVTDIYPIRSICIGNRVLDCLEHGIKVYNGGTSSIIASNFVGAAQDRGIYLEGSDYVSIVGNTVDGASVQGIYIGDSTQASVGAVVSGNTVNGTLVGSSGGHGIQISTSSHRASVTGNVVTASQGTGIYILAAVGVAVTGNVCHGNGQAGSGASAGIMFYQSPNGVISGNVCSNNGTTGARGDGIFLWDAGTANVDITIIGNRCYDTGSGAAKAQNYGIRSSDASNYLTVASNALRGNYTGTHSLVGANNVYTAGAV